MSCKTFCLGQIDFYRALKHAWGLTHLYHSVHHIEVKKSFFTSSQPNITIPTTPFNCHSLVMNTDPKN